MMKTTLVLAMLLVFFMISNASAYMGFGICNFGEETVSSVVCTGPTMLSETKVENDVKVVGLFKASKASIGSLSVTGSSSISDSTVKGPTKIVGSLKANNVKFENNVSVVSNKISLSKSTVKGWLTINSKDSKPLLILQCGTQIVGSVVFEGEQKGQIQLSEDSIIHGNVVNAKIEFVKRNCD